MSKTVLVVDDSNTERRMTVSIVKKLGHEVIEADNGEAGIEAARQYKPDLIILDVVMPVMDGLAALRIIRKDETLRNIPVIICSSKNQRTDVAWGKAQGAKEYITKPLTVPETAKELAAKITALLGA